MNEVNQLPSHLRGFSSFRLDPAVCRSSKGESHALIETRISIQGKRTVYTTINDKVFASDSLFNLVKELDDLVFLSILREVILSMDGQLKDVGLLEIITRDRVENKSEPEVLLHLRLSVEGKVFTTSKNTTLTDCLCELQDLLDKLGTCKFHICYHCAHSSQAWDYLIDDRDFWCYRDYPETSQEIIRARKERRRASYKAREGGDYFVNAFHTCAGWRPRDL